MPPPRDERSGGPHDRRARADPFAFREGVARAIDEASDAAVRRLVRACREDLRLALGGEPDRDGLALLLRPLPGAARARRLALGVFDRSAELVATLDAYPGLPGPEAWLLGFVLVRPDLRGRGLATGLVSRVEGLAAASGCVRLEAVAPARNKAVLHFLRRAGFTPRREGELSIGGRSVRVLRLARELASAAVDATV